MEVKAFVEFLIKDKKALADNAVNYLESSHEKNLNFVELASLIVEKKYEHLLDYVQKLSKSDYFELPHPFYDVTTRAVSSVFDNEQTSFVLMIDKNNLFPWILVQRGCLVNYILSPEGVFIVNNPWGTGFLKVRMHLLKKLSILKFDNIKFKFLLSNYRPTHYYIMQLFHWYNLRDRIEASKFVWRRAFFILQQEYNSINKEKIVEVSFYLIRGMGEKYNNLFSPVYYQLNSFICQHYNIVPNNSYGEKDCLRVYMQIPGERRVWFQQEQFCVNAIRLWRRYFRKIVVYFDGMTSYEDEVVEYVDNSKKIKELFEKISRKFGKSVELVSLVGLNYKNKIKYCLGGGVDFFVAEAGTALLVPAICNKKGVIYYNGHEAFKVLLRENRSINTSYLKVIEEGAFIYWGYHLPWQHVYNLTLEILEELSAMGKLEVKNFKMHRLEVPPVELVAKQYELEQKLKIEIPIENVALYSEIEKQIKALVFCNNVNSNKISQKNNSNNIVNTGTHNSLQNKDKIISNLESKIEKMKFELQFKTAKDRIHSHLAYKLGVALMENSKSILGYIRMPYVLSYVKDKHKLEQLKYQEEIKQDPSLMLPPLEAYPDYLQSKKEKESLTYKLGLALIEADKTWYRGGYIKFYFRARRLKKEYEKRK